MNYSSSFTFPFSFTQVLFQPFLPNPFFPFSTSTLVPHHTRASHSQNTFKAPPARAEQPQPAVAVSQSTRRFLGGRRLADSHFRCLFGRQHPARSNRPHHPAALAAVRRSAGERSGGRLRQQSHAPAVCRRSSAGIRFLHRLLLLHLEPAAH